MSKRAPYEFAEANDNGVQYWRSLEERAKAGDPELRKALANDTEFAPGHTSTPPSEEAKGLGRRGFMTLVSSALALAGAAGCRRPVEKILPYSKMPEEVIPGIPTHYATVYNRRGEALGLLVECHEGRPTKIEPNPNHPASTGLPVGKGDGKGGTDLITQASILDLYDADRSKHPTRRRDARWDLFEKEFQAENRRKVESESEVAEFKKHATDEAYKALVEERLKKLEAEPETAHHRKEATWKLFETELQERLQQAQADRGARLRILMQPTNSPSVVRMKRMVLQRYPAAKIHVWSPVNDSNVREGTRIAFGAPAQPVYWFDRANVVLSLDSDFLQTEPGSVRNMKGFSRRRAVRSPKGPGMNRLYVVEPSLTVTGSNADHRLRLPATDIERFLVALTARVRGNDLADLAGALGTGELPAGVPAEFVDAVAADLKANARRSIVIAGSRQPATVHALVHALNSALQNFDATITLTEPTDPQERDNVADIRELADAINGNNVDTLLILGGNPLYDAPADLKLGELFTKKEMLDRVFSVHLSMHVDETGEKCTWSVPRAHEYEAWGDQRSFDGTVSVQQPLIRPLFDGWSDLEMLAKIAGSKEQKGHAIVRATMQEGQLRDRGLDCAPGATPGTLDCKDNAQGKTVLFARELDHEWRRALRDGFFTPRGERRPNYALNGREIGAALGRRQLPASPTKENLEVNFAPCPKMLDGRHANNAWLLEMPDPMTKLVWDNAALVSPKTARELGLRNGDSLKMTVGTRTAYAAVWILPGQADNTVALTLGWGRQKAGRLGTLKGFNAYPLRGTDAMHFATGVKLARYGDTYKFGQTQEQDTMAGRAIAREATYDQYQKAPNFAELQAPPPKKLPLWNDQPYVLEQGDAKGHQWGMVIDLNACTGCNACVIACQAENNVPVVGKIEVARGREMHWLRIDRYYVESKELGATADDPMVAFQPLACVHCEEAPCENVCPVNATIHSPEGLNEMAYNRCIGTRYCANNCPYKVRRFNYLNWHNDGVWTFTEPFPETYHLQSNPNVSVRFRGVMEKCTYCVQRIQAAKINRKRNNEEMQDGDVVTACAQTCPADAIVFGDLNDPKSKVYAFAQADRGYKLLDEIGTKPRTTYLGKLRNPNPALQPKGAPHAEKEHG